jgi:hypothetical protein
MNPFVARTGFLGDQIAGCMPKTNGRVAGFDSLSSHADPRQQFGKAPPEAAHKPCHAPS